MAHFILLPLAIFASSVTAQTVGVALVREKTWESASSTTKTYTLTENPPITTQWSAPADCLKAEPFDSTTSITTYVESGGKDFYHTNILSDYTHNCGPGPRTSCCPPGWRDNGFYIGTLPGGYELVSMTSATDDAPISTPFIILGSKTEMGQIACPTFTGTEKFGDAPGSTGYLWSTTVVSNTYKPICVMSGITSKSLSVMNNFGSQLTLYEVVENRAEAPAAVLFKSRGEVTEREPDSFTLDSTATTLTTSAGVPNSRAAGEMTSTGGSPEETAAAGGDSAATRSFTGAGMLGIVASVLVSLFLNAL